MVLGDLIDFVDYHDHGGGILGSVFGAETVGEFARLRRERPTELPAFASERCGPGSATPARWSRTRSASSTRDCSRRCEAGAAPTYATPGNVDVPDLWPEFAGDGVRVLDGEVVELGGLRFGFVGGALLPPGVAAAQAVGVFRPYLRTEADFTAGVARLSDVDVVCSHIPPDVPELTYDVVARRSEFGLAPRCST